MAGLATAHGLTNTPERKARYEVTVYESGWRVGGKCASGRNPDHHDRIEEHGLHVWFGSYDNAFRMLRECYEDYPWPTDAPFTTVEGAFIPSNEVVLWDNAMGSWVPAILHAPPHRGQPGDPGPPPGLDGVILAVIDHVTDSRRAVPPTSGGSPDRSPAEKVKQGVALRIGLPVLEASARRLTSALSSPRTGQTGRLRWLLACLRRARRWLWEHGARPRLGDADIRHRLTNIDLGLTLIVGFLVDDVLTVGFDALNDEDFHHWLKRHGASDETLASPWVRAWYDGAFAFLDGSTDKPDIAAGSSLHAILRQQYGYKGAFVWKLRAGMGETVIAPIYGALQERGVTFKFFRRVTSIEIDPDAKDPRAIRRIKMEREPGPADGFDPLREVGGMRVWSTVTPPPDADHDPTEPQSEVLEAGRDFDIAVLAIPVGALAPICGELIADETNPAFATMIASARTTMTQSVQLWTTAPVADLGWSHGGTLSSTYVEPLDTYCDMSHLLEWEDWPASANVRGVGYFCGVSPDPPAPSGPAGARAAAMPPAARPENPAQAGGAPIEVVADVEAYLKDNIATLWPGAASGGSFDWTTLASPTAPGSGPAPAASVAGRALVGADRLATQYVRLNSSPSERYVLSPSSLVKYRLRADESGYDNLVLAGDWTKNDLDVGCVEAAVMSGLDAANVIVRESGQVQGRRQDWLHGRPPTPRVGPAAAWHDATLETMRQVGDPEADAVAVALMGDLDPGDHAGTVLTLRSIARADPADADGPVTAFLNERPPLPTWCDPRQMEVARNFFEEWWLVIGSTLLCASLPAGYAAGNGVQALKRTGRMLTGPDRRVVETAQLVMDVMQPGGLEPGSTGWTELRKVRLMHAAVRHLIESDPGAPTHDNPTNAPWDAARWGRPLNQEDLLGTLWTFSLTTIEALRRCGVPVSAEEAAAYLHTWCVAGHVLGVAPDLLPLDAVEAERSFDAIRRRQYAPTVEGRELAGALVKMIRQLIPYRALDGLAPSAIRYLAGDEVATILGIDPSDWTKALFGPARLANTVAGFSDEAVPGVAWLSRKVGLRVWKALEGYVDPGSGAQFAIPTSLADGFGLPHRSPRLVGPRRRFTRR